MKNISGILLCCVLLSSCHTHVNETTVVTNISLTNESEFKYRVQLVFSSSEAFLYTNKEYTVGDTLEFIKK